LENTSELQNQKTEDQDKKSLSSVSVPGAGTELVSYRLPYQFHVAKKSERENFLRFVYLVPPTGRFYEPFLKDLELIWRIERSQSSE